MEYLWPNENCYDVGDATMPTNECNEFYLVVRNVYDQ